MLDINFIRENPEKVKQGCKNKNIDVDINKVLDLDKKKRGLMQKTESLRAEQKKMGKDNIEKAKELKNEFKKLESELQEKEKELNVLIHQIPNIPFGDVPVGKDDSENVVLRKDGKIPNFKFKPKEHFEIGEALDIIDSERAGKVSGSRFSYLKNELPLLEFALIKFGLDILVKKGFIPIIPPVMLKKEMARGTGYFEAADEKEAYFLPEDKMYLVGTAEQSLVAMHANEVLNEKNLPRRYVAFSTCFRREAGSYGKDTKGIIRVHQFDKLEMVVFSKPEESKKEHDFLLSLEEEMMKKLGLPYQIIKICTGDLGMPAAAKYDIEAWMPGQNKYRETHSTSNCTDFQARRLNVRYCDKNNKLNFVHTLNGTALAIGRIIVAILENYQQEDGKVEIPKVLRKYLGFKIIPKK